MHIPQLIERKRDGEELTPNEIAWVIKAFTSGQLADYQMSALAMAVFFSGMTQAETAALTAAMRDSGRVFRYPAGSPPKVDKHSTGGVGDKISLILAPLLACDGLWVPMVSGRGLGITGGTLDKLESIPGFNVALSERAALAQLDRIGVFMAGQTDDFCPADRKLYALRDVTGTVPSQPLIVASILSKKLAESLDRLVLDVKFGSGAFMKTRADAEQLAHALTGAARDNGLQVAALITDMSQPLGHTVGNALEVAESVDVLQGRGPADVIDLTLDLAAQIANSPRDRLAEILASGAAWDRFAALTEAQGGDASALERITSRHAAPVVKPLVAPQSGTVVRVDAGMIGRLAVQLGAGRRLATDDVDHAVGFAAIRKIGDPVERGDTLLEIHARSDDDADRAAHTLSQAIVIE